MSAGVAERPQTPATVLQSMQHSPGSILALKQLLMKQSNDMKQRAICGRPPGAAEMCPMAVLQALGSSQATAHHMNLMQDR